MNGAPITPNGCISRADGTYVCGTGSVFGGGREPFVATQMPTLGFPEGFVDSPIDKVQKALAAIKPTEAPKK